MTSAAASSADSRGGASVTSPMGVPASTSTPASAGPVDVVTAPVSHPVGPGRTPGWPGPQRIHERLPYDGPVTSDTATQADPAEDAGNAYPEPAEQDSWQRRLRRF